MLPMRKNMMIKAIFIKNFLAVLLTFPLVFSIGQALTLDKSYATINQQINFQGRIVNTDGTNVTDGTYSFVFSIYTVSTAGSAVWTETQSLATTSGIFQANLGSVTSLPGSVNFNTNNIYLGVAYNSGSEMTPRIQFDAVPQAFNAQTVGGLSVTDTTGTLTIPNGKTISFSDAFTTSGTGALTLTVSGATNISLPTSGTLATLQGAETLTNKTLTSPTINSATFGGSTGITFGAGVTSSIDTATATGLTLLGRGSSSFSTTAGYISLAPAAGSSVLIGYGAGGSGVANPSLLELDVKSTAGDPTGYNGSMYYNNNANVFRCYQNSAWGNCIGAASPFTTTSGVIAQTNTGDEVQLKANLAGNYGLQVLGNVANPSVDLVTFDNGANPTTSTSTNALTINYTQNASTGAIVGSGISIKANASSEASGTINGLSVSSLTNPGSASSYGINIGTGWQTGIYVAAGGETINAGGLTINSGAVNVNANGISSGSANLYLKTAASQTVFIEPGGGSSGLYVQIGAGGAGGTTPDLLALDTKNTLGDPTGTITNGAMYYNSAMNKMRCAENKQWGNCGISTPYFPTLEYGTIYFNGINSTSLQNMGFLGAPSVNGTPTTNAQSDNYYTKYTSTATIGSVAGLRNTSLNNTENRYNPKMVVNIHTGGITTNVRQWVGLSSATLPTSDSPSSSNILALRFSTSAADTNWMCITSNGSTTNSQDTGVVYAANTSYQLILDDTNSAAPSCSVVANGATPVVTNGTLNIDSTGIVPLGINVTSTTLAAVASDLSINQIYMEML